jgi:hypothetical protein
VYLGQALGERVAFLSGCQSILIMDPDIIPMVVSVTNRCFY